MRARTLRLAAAALALFALSGVTARAAETADMPNVTWSFSGIFGTFDPAARQRGFQVYKEVCANCHGVKQLRYRDLVALGYDADQVRAFAAEITVRDGFDDAGEPASRLGRPADPFKRPYANDQAARAANEGALPPDLTLMTKARVGGATYLYSVLTGYDTPPPGVAMTPGMAYNRYFPGHQIGMPPPLSPDKVVYSDGTKATVEQMSHDVVTFLSWAAEPEMEVRKAMGVKVILFLVIFTLLMYAVKRRVWAKLH